MKYDQSIAVPTIWTECNRIGLTCGPADKERSCEDLQNAFVATALKFFTKKKPGDQWWMVVDYRKFNENIEPDKYPWPQADTIFGTLRQWFPKCVLRRPGVQDAWPKREKIILYFKLQLIKSPFYFLFIDHFFTLP